MPQRVGRIRGEAVIRRYAWQDGGLRFAPIRPTKHDPGYALATSAEGKRQGRAFRRSQLASGSDHGVGVFRKLLVVGERDLAHLDDLVLVASDHHDLLEEGPGEGRVNFVWFGAVAQRSRPPHHLDGEAADPLLVADLPEVKLGAWPSTVTEKKPGEPNPVQT